MEDDMRVDKFESLLTKSGVYDSVDLLDNDKEL